MTADAPPAPQNVRPLRTRARAPHRDSSGYWFAAPYVLLLAAFLLWPLVAGLYMSVTDTSLMSPGGFIGLQNYAEAFTDVQVWRTLGNTLVFTLITTVPLVLIALVMAVLVYAALPGQWLWRLAFFAPFLLPVAVVVSVWAWLYQPDIGLLNSALASMGLEGVNWLGAEGTAMISIAIATVWWTIGFNFLLYLAALQAIPATQLEAAMIDGAGSWRRFQSVILPQLSTVTGVIIILQILASLKVFDQIYLFTAGGPNGSTRSILEYIYDTGFTGYRLGYASAISYVFFAIIVVVALARYLPGRTRKEGAE